MTREFRENIESCIFCRLTCQVVYRPEVAVNRGLLVGYNRRMSKFL